MVKATARTVRDGFPANTIHMRVNSTTAATARDVMTGPLYLGHTSEREVHHATKSHHVAKAFTKAGLVAVEESQVARR